MNGLYFPFAFEGGPKGSPERTKYTVEKVEVNVPLDDALFTMPVSKPEAKSAVLTGAKTGARVPGN